MKEKRLNSTKKYKITRQYKYLSNEFNPVSLKARYHLRQINSFLKEKEEIKKEQLFDRSNDINQMNTINETLNTKCDLLNEELDIKEKELSHLIGKYTRLAEKREKILNNLITKKREQNLMTMRSQRNQNDLCGITVEANEKGCGCEIGDFCFIF